MNKRNAYYLFFPPSLVFCGLRHALSRLRPADSGLCHAEAELLRGEGGRDEI